MKYFGIDSPIVGIEIKQECMDSTVHPSRVLIPTTIGIKTRGAVRFNLALSLLKA